jgi:hypothetical protein
MVNAREENRPGLAAFYQARFRPEFKPAFEAWLATNPFTNKAAPRTPFAMRQYRLKASAEADKLDLAAAADSQVAKDANERADNYVLAVVLFASALFFAGISTKLQVPSMRWTLLAIGLDGVPRNRDLAGHASGAAYDVGVEHPSGTPAGSGSSAPCPLCFTDAEQPAREVDVVPVESEQLAASQSAVGHQREQQPVALGLPGKWRFQRSQRPGWASSRSSSAIVNTSGSTSCFFGVRKGSAGSRRIRSSSTRKRRNSFSAAVVRAWLKTPDV